MMFFLLGFMIAAVGCYYVYSVFESVSPDVERSLIADIALERRDLELQGKNPENFYLLVDFDTYTYIKSRYMSSSLYEPSTATKRYKSMGALPLERFLGFKLIQDERVNGWRIEQ